MIPDEEKWMQPFMKEDDSSKICFVIQKLLTGKMYR